MAEEIHKPPPALDLRPPRVAGSALVVWAQRHLQSFFFALGQISRAPVGSVFTVLVIAVALAVPAGLYTLLSNSIRVAQSWDSGAEVSLFLQTDLPVAQAQRFASALEARPEIEATRLIPAGQALAEFSANSGMAEADILVDGKNPLPSVVVARVRDDVGPESYPLVLEGLQGLPEVAHADFDMAWLNRLRAIMVVVQRGLAVVATLLAVGVLLIVGNTIRVEIDTRRAEIETARLFGATNAFIRRPFLYGGLLIGGAASLLAWAMVSVALLFLREPVNRLATLYTSQYQLTSPSLGEGLVLVIAGMSLGVLGAMLAVGRHLRGIQPD